MIAHQDRYLIKFIIMSSVCFFIGTVHGVLQVIPPVRHWLDSIGSPYGGPGHMIDPLAHAHINLIGGVTILAMATTYYLLPHITRIPLYSNKMAEHSFWWTAIGVLSFYTTLMIFGTVEGNMLLSGNEMGQADIHHYYGLIISVASSIMAVGLWLFLLNVLLSLRKIYKHQS